MLSSKIDNSSPKHSGDQLMDLEASLASPADQEFAWQLFSSFVRENLFSGISGARSGSDWDAQSEREKFGASWDDVENYIISVDGERIGWFSLNRQTDKVRIENWQLLPEWTGRKVTKTILSHVLPELQSQGLSVEAEILQEASMTKEAESVASRLGFTPAGDQQAAEGPPIKLMRLD